MPSSHTVTTRTAGTYETTAVAGEKVSAFVPDPLPPAEPAFELDGRVLESLWLAEQTLDKLELAADLVPSVDWFLYAFVRKEAVVSSQIEGTQATLDDLLRFEARAEGTQSESAASADVEEICNHLDALAYARRQLADPEGLPLSMRLLHRTHARLMSGARGADKLPGEVRRSQNWLSGTRPGNAAFVPPPPHRLAELLSDLEKFIHAESDLPPLVRAGLVHVQFETIHPYLDGNGRIGRLLVTLLLEHWKLLGEPLLYLSLYFKRHRAEYYRRLDAVRREGDWEGWIAFFLDGVVEVGREAVASARDLAQLVARDREMVLEEETSSMTILRLFESLPRRPIVTAPGVRDLLGVTLPTAGRSIEALAGLGILEEITGKQRDREWSYREYVDRLRVGTELPA